MPADASPATIRLLPPHALPSIFPLMAQQNPGLARADFDARLAAMIPLGYQAIAAFVGDDLAGCCGFWQRVRFWSGREFDIDNFVIDGAHRGRGIGSQMMAWLEQHAIEVGAELMVLDVYADSFMAHRFYMRHGFSLTGYHMTKIPGSTTPFRKPRDR